MISRSRLLFLSALVAAVGACTHPASDSTDGSDEAVTQAAFDKNDILDDKSLRDATAMTAEDVQRFLDKTPWGTKSVLATYQEGGKTAAQLLTASAQKYGINPLVLLVRVQMEQSLVSSTTAKPAIIAIGFGCGCPDSQACSEEYKGFGNQAECSAGTLRRSMDRAVTSAGTASGWARDKEKTSMDGIAVKPANAATAALYTYTPWVGEIGGGKKGIGGTGAHFQIWNSFATAVGYGAWATESADPSTGDSKDSKDGTGSDAGAPASNDAGSDPGSDPGTDPGTGGADAGPSGETKAHPPDDGSDDDALLQDGNAPPASNGAPPSSGSSRTSDSPDYHKNLPRADIAEKSDAGSGCSTSGRSGGSNAALIALAAAASIASRRRRR